MGTRTSILLTALVATLLITPATSAEENSWLTVEIGIIGTASADILDSAINEVEENGHDGLVIILDTPGGALDTTRTMVKAMMAAPFPVLVWVGPSGSRAGSAGAFITLAAHLASMAPSTNIGAAHPIQASGKDIDDEHAAKKIEADTAAFIESIALARKRNVEMARSFVITSASITAVEAKEQNVIDYIAKDLDEVFANAKGRQIELQNGATFTMPTSGVKRATYQRSIKQSFLEILSNPNLFYLLFVGGLIGIGFELTHPGSLVPGVVGGICLILALIATSVLPVSFGAMLLVLAGVAFMVAEIFIPSFGVLGIGGFVAFIIGSFLLVDPGNEQGLRISFWTIVPGALVVAGSSALIGYLVLRAERSPVVSGAEGMLGSTGTVLSDFVDGEGKIKVSGEIWQAKLSGDDAQLMKNDTVTVDRIDGLDLYVSRKP